MVKPLLVNTSELLRRPGTERVIETALTAAELGLDDPRFTPEADVRIALRLESLSDGIVVLGDIDVPWHGACRRCLRDLAEHTVSDVDELYQVTVTDPDAFPIAGEQLDLLPMVRELALLDAPEAPLCRPDCKGLCTTCGVDLNETTCTCSAPEQTSPWDVLNQLKGQLEAN